ncbi:hypothetical protein [Cohnella sp. 56]|uniref:hypothetical protein n=1 Tax=Cohnella sp. 56 TaxID=3113722 RepID=UPI0030E87641
MSWKLIHRAGEVYDADFSPLTRKDMVQLRKSDGWTRGIDWGIYLQPNQPFSAYKLQIMGDTSIQGLVSIAIREGFVELALAEKAPFNRKPTQRFINAGELLFAKACKTSLEKNGEGYVLLQAKSNLIAHYIDYYGMEVVNVKNRHLAIPPIESRRLVEVYWDQRSG